MPAVEESIASEYTYHIEGDRYGQSKRSNEQRIFHFFVPDVIACEIPDLYPLIVGDYGELVNRIIFMSGNWPKELTP